MKGCNLPWILRTGRLQRVLLFSVFLSLPGYSQQPDKPRCTAQTRGQFWPDEANHDPKAARALAKEGKLELCTAKIWRYRWEPLSVTLTDLIKKRDQKRAVREGNATTSD